MTFYDQMQGVAQGLLRTFNQGGIVYSVATPGGGPAHAPLPTTYADTEIDGTVRGVSAEYVDNVHVLATDLMLTIPGGVVTPKVEDVVKLSGAAHSIVKIMPKPATGTVAAYVLVIRK